MNLTSVTLEGQHIRLEPMEWEHLDSLCEIGLDPRLWAYTTIRVRDRDEMKAYMEKALRWRDEGTALPFIVRELASGQIIGTTRFHHFDAIARLFEIGFTWLIVEWQGKGLNTEAKRLLLNHAFKTLGIHRVGFKADSENWPSRKALERIGATFEGIARGYIWSVHKGWRDIAVYSILDSDIL